jgi:spore coat polysaccharide biosynthesis protein SpsF
MSAVNLAIVLQARIDSSRLPEKALLPLGEEKIISCVMEALNSVPAQLRILACPDDSAAAFAPLADKAGFTLLTGPKDDVLGRYCLALRTFNIQRVIRATGDNPFVFADAAAAINAEALALNADYAGYGGLPYGAGVESVSAAALLRAETEASASYEREHVCPYLYAHPELFSLHRPLAPLRWQGSDIRLTIDTREDYERAQALYTEMDRLEKAGKIGSEERYRGMTIINAYRALFPYQGSSREYNVH